MPDSIPPNPPPGQPATLAPTADSPLRLVHSAADGDDRTAKVLSLRDGYVASMRTRVAEHRTRIENLKLQLMRATTADRRSAMQTKVRSLEGQHRLVARRLDELRAADADRFFSLRAGFESACRDLAAAVERSGL